MPPAMSRCVVLLGLLLVVACEPRGVTGAAEPWAATAVATSVASTTATASAVPAPPPAMRLVTGGEKAVEGSRGMVASEDAHATQAGVAILQAGGNAIDAAIAVCLLYTSPSPRD